MTKMTQNNGLRTLTANEIDLVNGGNIDVKIWGWYDPERPIGMAIDTQQAIARSAQLAADYRAA
jgi:hypothetical protein